MEEILVGRPSPRARGGAVHWTRRILRGLVHGLLAGLLVPGTVAAQAGETVAEQGRRLYGEHCALCHGDSGAGRSGAFPALDGNERLGNAARVVRAIGEGIGNMPAFPALTAAETAAVASYVRGAWSNGLGAVSADAAAAVLDRLADGEPAASVWDGVYTDDQAARGRQIYFGACSLCHGRRLNGAPDDPDMVSTPPLARARFLRVWEGRSLAVLLAYTRLTMPEDNPASLTDQEYVDVVAYMLSMSRMPAGDDELSTDASGLAHIVVRPRQ
jgi:mono/diheme cytochrome c family protein